MGRHDRSDNEDDWRERRKSRKSKRCNSDDENDRKRRKKESASKKSKRKRDRRHYESSESDDYSDDADRRHKRHKKKKHKKEKKKRKADRDESPKPADPLQRNYDFTEALHDLFDDHPALSSDLPVMLIRMAGGSSFDLSQMSDVSAAKGLENVFGVLQAFGVERTGRSWTWKAPPGGGQGRNNQLLLVQVAKTLLDQIGVTMEAVDNYGKEELAPTSPVNETPTSQFTPLQKQTFSVLDRFLQKDATLANQMGELCSMILNGESVALGGLPDQNLRDSLEQLFRGAGLNLLEMDEDEEEEKEEATTMGYGLPEENDMFARANMESILSACKYRVELKQEAPRRAMRGPLPQSMAADYVSRAEQDDSGDDDGPAPAGMEKMRNGPSKRMIQAMAEHRQEQLDALSDKVAVTKPGEREEWMINPGEHDLLQGIKSGGMKSRNFENKKVNARSAEMPAATVDPSMQAEVDAIIQAHKDARGPSLMDNHRENMASEKAEKAEESGTSFNWNRDKDLDSGRRVDKDALRLLMGGAGGGLQDKFQGGFSKT